MAKAPRLSETEYRILQMLVNEPRGMYGLQLIKQSKGKLKRGSIYVLLSRLEDKGYVKAKSVAPPDGEGGKPRRLYQPTGTGQRAAEAYELMLNHFEGRTHARA